MLRVRGGTWETRSRASPDLDVCLSFSVCVYVHDPPAKRIQSVALGFLRSLSTINERLDSITMVNKTQICQMVLLNWKRKEIEGNTLSKFQDSGSLHNKICLPSSGLFQC